MPTLHIKNKITLSIQNVISDAVNRGGIPNYVSVTPKEAMQLVKEVQELGLVSFHFSQNESNDEVARLNDHVKYHLKEHTHEARKLIVTRWHQGQYQVHYAPKTTTKQVSGMPSNTTTQPDPIEIRVVKETKPEEKDSSDNDARRSSDGEKT